MVLSAMCDRDALGDDDDDVELEQRLSGLVGDKDMDVDEE